MKIMFEEQLVVDNIPVELDDRSSAEDEGELPRKQAGRKINKF